MRTIWGNREVLAAMAQRCACGHAAWEHGLWVDSNCVMMCACPGFYVGARVRLGTRWES